MPESSVCAYALVASEVNPEAPKRLTGPGHFISRKRFASAVVRMATLQRRTAGPREHWAVHLPCGLHDLAREQRTPMRCPSLGRRPAANRSALGRSVCKADAATGPPFGSLPMECCQP